MPRTGGAPDVTCVALQRTGGVLERNGGDTSPRSEDWDGGGDWVNNGGVDAIDGAATFAGRGEVSTRRTVMWTGVKANSASGDAVKIMSKHHSKHNIQPLPGQAK